MTESDVRRNALEELLPLCHAERFTAVLILLESLSDENEPGEPSDHEMAREFGRLQLELVHASRSRPEMIELYLEWLDEFRSWIYAEEKALRQIADHPVAP